MTENKSQRGFTLVELIVVIAIMGVLAAIVVPAVIKYLGSGSEEAYNTDTKTVQRLVDIYYADKDSPRLRGQAQYPIMGASKGTGTMYNGDVDTTPETASIDGNIKGGTIGGTPTWVDDGDGTRETAEEVLNDEDTLSTVAGWHVATVIVSGTTYYTDTRDYFIDFDLMVTQGVLKSPPESASSDNCAACTGSYSYYLDANNLVKTLLQSLPTSSYTGYQDVFP